MVILCGFDPAYDRSKGLLPTQAQVFSGRATGAPFPTVDGICTASVPEQRYAARGCGAVRGDAGAGLPIARSFLTIGSLSMVALFFGSLIHAVIACIRCCSSAAAFRASSSASVSATNRRISESVKYFDIVVSLTGILLL
jgi:hypothetical protein